MIPVDPMGPPGTPGDPRGAPGTLGYQMWGLTWSRKLAQVKLIRSLAMVALQPLPARVPHLGAVPGHPVGVSRGAEPPGG